MIFQIFYLAKVLRPTDDFHKDWFSTIKGFWRKDIKNVQISGKTKSNAVRQFVRTETNTVTRNTRLFAL